MDNLERRVARLEQEMTAVVEQIDAISGRISRFRAGMERGFSRLLGRPWTVESALASLVSPSADRDVVTIRRGIPLALSFQKVATGLPADTPSIGERDGEPKS